MEKRLRRSAGHGQVKQEEVPARKHVPGKNTRQGAAPCTQLQGLFQSLPQSTVLCDQAGKILQFNAAALMFFEVSDETLYKGTSLRQFLHAFQQDDDPHLQNFPQFWLSSPLTDSTAELHPLETTLFLYLPSGRKISVYLRYEPLLDREKRVVGTSAIFQEATPPYQKELHLQQVHEVIVALNMAIASFPAYGVQQPSEELLLLSPLVSSVAQPLVDVIGQVLNGRRVFLLAIGSTGQLSYIAGSGFTAEQEQIFRTSEEFISMYVDEQVLARLSAHQEVLLASQDLHKRSPSASAFGPEKLLILPLFLGGQFAGVLTVFKEGSSSGYTPDETEFAKILVVEIELLVQCLSILRERIGSETRALVQQEIGYLSNGFLTLAGHELKTPLTSIVGNIQLAQRRLVRLKRRVRERAEEVSTSLEQLEDPLTSAIESARLQQRVIHEMIDTLSIQTQPQQMRMKEENLLTLLQETLTRLKQSVPERMITLEIPPRIQAVLIRADGQQIIQVLTNYLVNALSHTLTGQPVTIRLVVTDTVALVTVHDEGLGIMTEEEKSLWQRFSGRKGYAIQHEADVNLGTGFHLCRMIIGQHHGQLGVQSHSEQGTTFWLTLPIEALLEQ